MQTPRPTPSIRPLSPAPIHDSQRTAISANLNPETGAIERVLTTSRLLLTWQAGELCIRFEATTAKLRSASRDRPMRPARRML
ncbi:MAG: hypothetical protein WBC18_14695 [Ottowia sp.]|uniref:hypothetical protein n=1 Tax=Ottowia sp. TaxID=1898956 RepID=UPI003C7326C9